MAMDVLTVTVRARGTWMVALLGRAAFLVRPLPLRARLAVLAFALSRVRIEVHRADGSWRVIRRGLD